MTTTYGPTPATEGHALQVVMEQRVAELLRYRRWWRANRWADWPELRTQNDAELRALVKLMRRARRIAATAYDPITMAKQRGWTESEQRFAAGDR